MGQFPRRRQQVDRMRYAVELAQRRYMSVDPTNRLVAAELETEWNEALSALRTAEEEYHIQQQADRLAIGEERKAQILALATDFPRLWNDPRTAPRDRKRLLRLLVEDVTLLRGTEITAHVRFKGGAVRTLTLPLPLAAPQRYRTSDAVVREIDRLLDEHTAPQVAEIFVKDTQHKILRQRRPAQFAQHTIIRSIYEHTRTDLPI